MDIGTSSPGSTIVPLLTDRAMLKALVHPLAAGILRCKRAEVALNGGIYPADCPCSLKGNETDASLRLQGRRRGRALGRAVSINVKQTEVHVQEGISI